MLPREKYEHFLYSHAAIRILRNQNLTKAAIRCADDFLKYFADQFGRLYGYHHLVYNVHSLSHLANESRIHGKLDYFSAYPFESFIGSVQKPIQSGNNPFAKLCRRLSEFNANGLESVINRAKIGFDSKYIKPSRLSNGSFVKIISMTETSIFFQEFKEISD